MNCGGLARSQEDLSEIASFHINTFLRDGDKGREAHLEKVPTFLN